MNEIAAFREGGTIERASWHRADAELGGAADHSRYHNVYGLLMTQATKEGMLLGERVGRWGPAPCAHSLTHSSHPPLSASQPPALCADPRQLHGRPPPRRHVDR